MKSDQTMAALALFDRAIAEGEKVTDKNASAAIVLENALMWLCNVCASEGQVQCTVTVNR